MQLLRLVVAGLALLAPTLLHAQAPAWPTKSIRWIIPYPPGGITDNATRMVVQRITEQTGWTIVVENKPGANSILGADLAAKAAPDGYTFLTVIAAHAANATLYAGKLPFDVVKSFAPVSLVGIAPLIMTANNDLPVKDVRELIAYAKANPGRLSYGSSGVGAAAHLTTELFNQTSGVHMVHVPYKGTAPALQDLMGGNIQILVDVPSTLMPQVRAGKIKALGMFSAKRVAGAAEIPTIAEAGFAGFDVNGWMGLVAPAGLPQSIVDRLNSELTGMLAEPGVIDRIRAFGNEPRYSTPDGLKTRITDEIAKWSAVIDAVKIERI